MSDTSQNPNPSVLPAEGRMTGEDVRNYRTGRGLTQKELAVEWKISSRTISNWELAGEKVVPSRAVARLRLAYSRKPRTGQGANKHRDLASSLLAFDARDLDSEDHAGAMVRCLQGIGHAILSLETEEAGR